MTFTKDELCTIWEVMLAQVRARQDGPRPLSCVCRTSENCGLCRPLEELEAIVRKCEEMVFQKERVALKKMWEDKGFEFPH